MERPRAVWYRAWMLIGLFHLSAVAGNTTDLVHGLWVWHSQTALKAPHSVDALLKFCESKSINEVYVSVAADPDTLAVLDEPQVAHLIGLLHRSNIRWKPCYQAPTPMSQASTEIN